MKAFEVLALLENTASKNKKKEILKQNAKNKELADLLDAAFNYERRFYMKKWKTSKGALEVTHDDFMKLLKQLETRQITGNEALQATEDLFSCCNDEQAKWYARALRKDLKIGVSVETAIECGFDIPAFDVELATDGKKCKKLDQLLKMGCLASRKLDGFRCIAVIEEGEVTLLSRNGTPYENFPIIQEELEDRFSGQSLVLDGEIMSDDFNAMQQTAFASKRGTAVGDVVYNIFDVLDLEEWKVQKFTKLHAQRVEELKELFDDFLKGCKHFKRVIHTPVKTLEQILELEVQYLEEGFEGVMINPNIPYYIGRKANAMLKFKTMKSMDCIIQGFYEGKTGKTVGVLGGYIVLQENNVVCDVGSGITDADRVWIWNHKDEVLGGILEVKYQELTKDGKMRFPVAFRHRHDKE